MAKIEEKAKVGRPKLADEELIKDSWFKVGASLSVALVMAICGLGVLTDRTPLQVLTFQNPDKIQGSVANINEPNLIDVNSLNNTVTIQPNKQTTKIIKPNGEVTVIIPAQSAEIINIK